MTRSIKEIDGEIELVRAAYDKADRKVRSWITARSTLKQRLDVLLSELRIASYPPETSAPAVMFRKRYAGGAKTYSFGAIKAERVWWVTGSRSPQGLTWRELVDFARKDNVLPVHTLEPLHEEALPF